MKYLSLIFVCLFFTAPHLAFSKDVNEAIEPSILIPKAINLLEDGTLDAWKVPSDHWSLEGGSIVGQTGKEKIKIPEWIYTKQGFGDFMFTCEMKLTGDESRNTGIYFRANPFTFGGQRGGKSFEAPSGYEFDAAFHQPGTRNNRGSLADWYARPSLRILPDQSLINQVYKVEDWNRMTIRARGNRLEYWLNATKIMDFQDPDPKGSREGIIGFQIHNGSVMKVECRNIQFLPLESEES